MPGQIALHGRKTSSSVCGNVGPFAENTELGKVPALPPRVGQNTHFHAEPVAEYSAFLCSIFPVH